MKPSSYLFDLDGTLADSAPDLAAAANHLRVVRNLPALPFEVLRKTASSGARGLLGAAFNIKPEDPGYDELAKEFLDYYEAHLADHARVFPGVDKLIDYLESNNLPWGVVTNKHKRFTEPLLKVLKLTPDVVVCGDTLERRKPFPDPIIFALKSLNQKPAESIYVGDDIRDIQAGNAAGCFTIAAAWGYLGSTEPIEEWGAGLIMRNPSEIINFTFSK